MYLAPRPALFPHLLASHLDSSSLMAPALQILRLKLTTLLIGPAPLTDSGEHLLTPTTSLPTPPGHSALSRYHLSPGLLWRLLTHLLPSSLALIQQILHTATRVILTKPKSSYSYVQVPEWLPYHPEQKPNPYKIHEALRPTPFSCFTSPSTTLLQHTGLFSALQSP